MKGILKKVGKFILYSVAAIIVISIAADEFYISKDEIDQMEQERQEFTDGYYVCDVEYENRDTGHSNTYFDLDVLIVGDIVSRVYFENGGHESGITTLDVNDGVINAENSCCSYKITVKQKTDYKY